MGASSSVQTKPVAPTGVAKQPPLKSYSTVQFISLELCTMPHGFETQSKADDYYIGLQNPAEDLKLRIDIVRRWINAAISDPAVDTQALKVFMMPEFFFRGKIGNK